MHTHKFANFLFFFIKTVKYMAELKKLSIIKLTNRLFFRRGLLFFNYILLIPVFLNNNSNNYNNLLNSPSDLLNDKL